MDDLAGKITEMLGNPETMNKIKGLAGLLGQSETKSSEEKYSENNEAESNQEFPDEVLQVFMKIAPFLSSMKKDDKNTRFLYALKPLLSEPRQQRLDEASKIMQIMQILPLLKSQEIL